MSDRSSARHVARRPVAVLVVILLLGAGAIAIVAWRPPLLIESGGAAAYQLCARTDE